MPEKRITLATIKAFIRKNRPNLQIKVRSAYDGMIDGLAWNRDAEFSPALESDDQRNALGIKGAWFVLGGRDHFQPFESATHVGYEVAAAISRLQLRSHPPRRLWKSRQSFFRRSRKLSAIAANNTPRMRSASTAGSRFATIRRGARRNDSSRKSTRCRRR
jgi:hypothetical protein